MRNFFKTKRFKILASVFVVLLFFMLRAAWTGGLSPLLAQVAGLVVTPIQSVSASISESVSGVFRRYIRAEETVTENEELRAENSALRRQMIEFEQYKRENRDLKQYYGIKDANPDFELEPASVVSRDNIRFYSFEIDKGSLNGISLHDPVICADGLVGTISELGLNRATVVTILDVEANVPAYVDRTRDIGIVTGTVALASEGQCKLTYLPRESGAAAGDTVVTSGSDLYPKNIIIGTIAAIRDEAGGISKYALIQPAADIRSLSEIMVIKSFDGQEEVVANEE